MNMVTVMTGCAYTICTERLHRKGKKIIAAGLCPPLCYVLKLKDGGCGINSHVNFTDWDRDRCIYSV